MASVIDERTYLEGVGRDLAAELPAALGRFGWRVANLEHGWERIPGQEYDIDDGEDSEPLKTPDTVREYWSVDIYGPKPDYEWRQFAGGTPMTILRPYSDITGSLAAPTPEALILMLREWLKVAGLTH